MHIFQTDNALIVLEGRIYNRDDIDRELRTLERIVLGSDRADQPKLLNWLDSLDGEFLIVLYDKSGERTFILNDILGRLPTFYYADKDNFILTRELNLIPRLLPSIRIDRLGLAQTLLFCFSLYGRTIIQNVHRLAPATMIRIDSRSITPGITVLNQLDYTQEAGGGSIRHVALELADLFTTACARRVNPEFRTTVSLSGGLDSRSVASAIVRAKQPVTAYTFAPRSNPNDLESTIASSVCAAIGIKWKPFLFEPVRVDQIEKLILDTSGLCNIANAEQEAFIEKIRLDYSGHVILFTGEGGDWIIPSLVPDKNFGTVASLVDYIAEKQQMLPLALVCRLTGVSEDEFKDELHAVLSRYPEPKIKDRFVHFMISERMIVRAFDGDNCNRNRLWTGTPFFSWPFLKRALAINDRPKRYHRLYRYFLDSLSHEAAALPDAKRGKSLLDKRYEYEQRAIRIVNRFPSLATRLRQRRAAPNRYDRDHSVIRLLSRLSESDSGLSDFIDRQSLGQVLSNTDSYSKESIDNLATACLAVLLYTNSDFNLTYFADREF